MTEPDDSVEWLACSHCGGVGIAGNYCSSCEDTGRIYDTKCDKSRKMPWWAVIRRLRARRPPDRKRGYEGGLIAGDRVIIVVGRADQVGKTGMVTTRKMAKMVEVQYCRTGTELVTTVKKGRESVIGLGPGLEVSRDERGTMWVTVCLGNDTNQSVVSDGEEESCDETRE